MKNWLIMLVGSAVLVAGFLIGSHNMRDDEDMLGKLPCPNEFEKVESQVNGTTFCNLPYSLEYADDMIVSSKWLWEEIFGTCSTLEYYISRLQVVWFDDTDECPPCGDNDLVNGCYDACMMRIWVRDIGDGAADTAIFHEICRFLSMECDGVNLPPSRKDWPEDHQMFVSVLKDRYR